jgi:hypothetical protein
MVDFWWPTPTLILSIIAADYPLTSSLSSVASPKQIRLPDGSVTSKSFMP